MNKSDNNLNKKRYRMANIKSEDSENSDLSDNNNVNSIVKKSAKTHKSNVENDDIIVGEDEVTFKLNLKKRVNVRKFKGNILIDIREYWIDDKGIWKPGKKGISLTEEAWQKFKHYLSDIDDAIKNMK